MKVKTLLKALKNVPFILQSESGHLFKEDFISRDYYGEGGFYEEWKVISITTVSHNDTLFITIKEV